MTPRAVSVYVSVASGWYTAAPYVKYLLHSGIDVHLLASPVVHELADLPGPLHRIPLPLPNPPRWLSILARIHELLRQALTPRSFSRSCRQLLYEAHPGLGFRTRLVNALSHTLPKWPAVEVNRRLRKFFSPLVPSVFPTNLVICVSKASQPVLLCTNKHRIVTIMESWDHAQARPTGYESDLVVAWNASLARTWRNYQGDRKTTVGYPVKLRYLFTECDGRNRRLEEPGKELMYAAGAHTQGARPDWYRDELTLLRALCRATGDLGIPLLIKPKPGSVTDDYQKFSRLHQHVTVGQSQAPSSPADYRLDNHYNRLRLEELSSCRWVLSCWTTFALDAACYGRPVIQLDLRDHPSVPSLARAFHHDHIATHLLADPEKTLPIDPSEPLDTGLRRILAPLTSPLADAPGSPNTEARARAFSDSIYRWLCPARGLHESVADATEEILKL